MINHAIVSLPTPSLIAIVTVSSRCKAAFLSIETFCCNYNGCVTVWYAITKWDVFSLY